jgi:flagellar export protein FliJ
MATFKYRLEPVLQKKQKLRDEAQEALAAAQAALREEERKKETLVAELEQLRVERKEARRRRQDEMLEKGMSGMGASRVQQFVDGTEAREKRKQEEITEQESAIESARLRLDEQKLILVEAAKEVQAMEKHKEETHARFKKELEVAEAREMDEIGTAIHLQRQRRGNG